MIYFPSYQIQNNTNYSFKQLCTPRIYPRNMQFECTVRKPLSTQKNVLAHNNKKRFEYCTAIQVIKCFKDFIGMIMISHRTLKTMLNTSQELKKRNSISWVQSRQKYSTTTCPVFLYHAFGKLNV